MDNEMMINKISENVPFQKHEVEEYERKRYRGLDQRIVHGREMRILRKILRRVQLNGQKGEAESHRALDIPCGYGRFSRLLQEFGFFLVNSDLSFHMVKRAEEKNPVAKQKAGVVADAKQGLPFKGRTFSVLLSMRFFHHLHEKEDREAILKEFYRVTSGWVVLSYYQRNWFHILQRKVRKRIMKKKTRIKMIPRREFSEEVRTAGFKMDKVFPVFRGIHSHHIVLLRKQGSHLNIRHF
jgi:SAM-dependent methyltransferase